MSFRKWYRRNRVLGVSLLACMAFLALALYGWGVTWQELWGGLMVLVGLLLLLVLSAAAVGWIIYKVMHRK